MSHLCSVVSQECNVFHKMGRGTARAQALPQKRVRKPATVVLVQQKQIIICRFLFTIDLVAKKTRFIIRTETLLKDIN